MRKKEFEVGDVVCVYSGYSYTVSKTYASTYYNPGQRMDVTCRETGQVYSDYDNNPGQKLFTKDKFASVLSHIYHEDR